jgi:hypothetical protein
MNALFITSLYGLVPNKSHYGYFSTDSCDAARNDV